MNTKSWKVRVSIAIISLIIITGLSYIFFFNNSNDTSAGNESSSSESVFLMDTLVEIKIFGNNSREIVDKGTERLKEIDRKMSTTDSSSDISKINNNPGEEIEVSEDTFLVIQKALEYAEKSEGKYDPTVGPLVNLWGIGTEEAQVPSEKDINSVLEKIDYNSVTLNEDKKTVKLEKEGMSLDLGGIAKGYAADEIEKLVKANYDNPSAYVNLGGNVLVVGKKADGSLWNIGIQDPRKNRGSVMASLETEDKTIVTSGNYERYFEENGEIYHHIFDPDTGRPVRNNLTSVSIVTDNSLQGDALSTTLYIMGLEKGLDFIENTEDTEALFITDDDKIIFSSGLEDKIEVLNSDFEISER